MGQRNMLCPHQMFDVEIDSGQNLLRPEPSLLLGNVVDFPNPNYHPLLSASGNTGNLDLCDFPSYHNGCIFYQNQYNNLQHHHPIANLDLAINHPPNFSYNPYMIPSSGPVPLNHGCAQHMPSSSNSMVFGVGLEEYNRAAQLMDNERGSCKRKNSEGIPGNHYHVNGPASLSSLSMQGGEPFGAGFGVIDTSALTAGHSGSNSFFTTEGSQRSVRSRASGVVHLDSAMIHHHNRFLQGNYMGGHVHSVNNGWVDQFQSHAYEPCLHTGFPSGRSVNGGSAELGDMGGEAYQDNTSNRPSGIFCSSHQQHHHPPMHSMGGQSYSYQSQLSGPSYRHLVNHPLHDGTLNSSRDGLEPGSRYRRALPSGGERINRPLRRVSHAPLEDSNVHMRMLSSEDVAMLEYSGFYGVGNLIDQHRDMRLDIDGMSYEELLALGEWIGDVKTGLSEESVSKCLKTRTHVSCAASYLDQHAGSAQDNGSCIICQVDYENQEKVGKLQCGHEYHADCIKQWLFVKNFCPICKANAFSEDERDAEGGR